MKSIPLPEAKANFNGLVDEVSRRGEKVVITRNGRPAVVLVSVDEYESWQETRAVCLDPGLMREIKSGLRAHKARKVKLYTLDELFK